MTGESKFAIAKAALGPLSLSERALLAVSKHPDDVDKTSSYTKPTEQWTVDNALSTLEEAFPDIRSLIKGKRILDYGCGDGFQSVALAHAGAASVLGVDVESNRLAHGRALAANHGAKNVLFAPTITGQFDIIISLNALEHFVAPKENIREMKAALAPGGQVYVSFGPLWLAPYGAHMYFFTQAPWINLAFPEAAVFRIRSLYRDDGALAYTPGLNRMTVTGFERLVRDAGLNIAMRRDHTAGNLPLIGALPMVRELFVNQIDAILETRS